MGEADAPAEDEPGYRGAAEVVHEGTAHLGEVVLVGGFEPISGRYRWHGRVKGVPGELRAGDRLAVRRPGSADSEVVVVERDLWGHLVVDGVGAPPFATFDPADLSD